jgi:hypothetical protein
MKSKIDQDVQLSLYLQSTVILHRPRGPISNQVLYLYWVFRP